MNEWSTPYICANLVYWGLIVFAFVSVEQYLKQEQQIAKKE